MNIRLLPLLIAAVLCAGGASAAPTGVKTPAPASAAAAPTAQQLANRAEIERLTARIRELSKDLGEGTQVRVITRTKEGSAANTSSCPNTVRVVLNASRIHGTRRGNQ